MVGDKSPKKGPGSLKTLMDLATGYQKSMVLLTSVKLGVFEALVRGPQTAEAIARHCGTHPRSTELLLNSCAALGLLSKSGGLYANLPLALRFLVPGSKSYLGYFFGLMEDGYRNWGRLPDAVRENHPVRPAERDAGRDPNWNRSFTMAMHQGAQITARQVAGILDLKGCRRLMDVGGGPGTFAMELVKRNPELEATVFDLPGVLEITRELVAENELSDRIRLQPGDYHEDSFGRDNDVVLLFGILHSESINSRHRLLTKVWESLAPGGLVVVRQLLLDEDRAGPPEASMFSLQMLLNTDSGECYTWQEIKSLLQESGFVDPQRQLISKKRPYWLVMARKA